MVRTKAGGEENIMEYRRGETVFAQGDRCEDVLYIQEGGVKLSVLSKTGREAVVATLGPGDFLGEECLAGQMVRTNDATAITPSTIQHVGIAKMARRLHTQHAVSDRFIAHQLSRYVQIEEDLIEQFLDSSEKRLARVLLRLAHEQTTEKVTHAGPKISQKTLPAMLSMTRPHVNRFLKKFRRLGFIQYNGQLPITINQSLLDVVLHD